MAGWRKIRNEYIAGDASYRALAKKHGVSPSTLSKVAVKEGWAEARKKHRHSVDAKTAEAMCARASAREIERLERLQGVAMHAVAVLEGAAGDPEQFKRHLVTESTAGIGTSVSEKVFKKLDMKAVKAYTDAINSLTATIRDLYDLPTVKDRSAMDVALERLKLDKRKAAEGETNAGETGIAEIAAVLPEVDGPDGAEETDGARGTQDGLEVRGDAE